MKREQKSTYGKDFYKGMPVLTKNKYGKGAAYYVATSPEQAFVSDLASTIAEEKGLSGVLDSETGVEVIARTKKNETTLFVMNHNTETSTFEAGEKELENLLTGEIYSGTAEISAKDVLILKQK